MTAIDYHLKYFHRASRANECPEIAPACKMARVPRSGLLKCRTSAVGKIRGSIAVDVSLALVLVASTMRRYLLQRV